MTVARYDCRREGRDPSARSFPCNVKIVDPATGARIPDVFFCDTKPEGGRLWSLGRFVRGPDGEPLVAPARKKRWADDGRGGRRLEIYYDRLEVWERRPWLAVALDTGEVVARSEEFP